MKKEKSGHGCKNPEILMTGQGKEWGMKRDFDGEKRKGKKKRRISLQNCIIESMNKIADYDGRRKHGNFAKEVLQVCNKKKRNAMT